MKRKTIRALHFYHVFGLLSLNIENSAKWYLFERTQEARNFKSFKVIAVVTVYLCSYDCIESGAIILIL